MNATSATAINVEETLPDSQQSVMSSASSSTNASSEPRLLSSLSDLSGSTGVATTLTSPSSSIPNSSQTQHPNISEPSEKPDIETAPRLDTGFNYREPHAPISATTGAESSSNRSTATTPLSSDAPVLVQGSKRTASGTVKMGQVNTPDPMSAKVRGHARNTSNMSIDSNSTTRGGELAAQLKARLSYAMVKVQHGWERHTLDELEEQTSQVGSPVVSRHGEHLRLSGSPQYIPRDRRLSAYSDNADRFMYSPGKDNSPRGISRSMDATPLSNFTCKDARSNASVHRAFMALNAAGDLQSSHEIQGNGLAPAAHIVSPRRTRRAHTTSTPPPMLSTLQEGKAHNGLRGLPRTPRQGILRMPSQQAEKDAVDTLLFMSSPNNSAHFAPANRTKGHGPYRPDLGSKKVAFEAANSANGYASPHYPMQA